MFHFLSQTPHWKTHFGRQDLTTILNLEIHISKENAKVPKLRFNSDSSAHMLINVSISEILFPSMHI